MAMQSKEEKLLDKEIDAIFKKNCANIQIDIFDERKGTYPYEKP